MVAMARRAGMPLSIDRFDELARRTPLVANIRPCGQVPDGGFLLRRRAARAAQGHRATCSRSTRAPSTARRWARTSPAREVFNRRRDPAARQGAGRPAAASRCCAATSRPDGAVIKPAAAEAQLLQHTGPAVVFADYNDMAARIDDPAAAGRRRIRCWCCRTRARSARPACRSGASCRSRRSCSPQGVRDMVRISDARMSGTSYGACVLHVAPESFVGGPLALVRDGDLIELDVPRRRLELKVDDGRAGAAPRRVEDSPRRATSAATARSTSSTSRRPTRAATSISSKAPRRRPSRRFTDDAPGCGRPSLSGWSPRSCMPPAAT